MLQQGTIDDGEVIVERRRAMFREMGSTPARGAAGQGLAPSLMQTALEWCRANSIRAALLHASENRRDLYEKVRFMGDE